MTPKISAVICTHNPRENYLRRVLDALRGQTLPATQWELLLIDNASQPTVSERFNLSWHPHARHIREEELGLTPARLRGITESTADTLVFVDDDAVLAPDYLEQALLVGHEWPFVGVWGGSSLPEYEKPVPDWCGNEVWRLNVVIVKEDSWSNLREGFATVPAGAGMCARRAVCLRFLERCRSTTHAHALGRKGAGLSGYEEVDLAFCGLDMGLGTGKTTRLSLTHLIPASRITLDYFVRHAEGDAASLQLFRAIRGLPVQKPTRSSLFLKLRLSLHYLLKRVPREIRLIHQAHQRGLKRGLQLVAEYRKTLSDSN